MPTSTQKKTNPTQKMTPKSQREGNPPFKGVTVRDHKYSESYDEYLEMILRLSHNSSEWVKNKDISKALNVKAPSVTNMLEKLSKAMFIEWIPRKGIRLTDRGVSRATELVCYHTIMELFLNRVLEIEDPHELDAIACDFEHHFTPTLKNRMKILLGLEEGSDLASSALNSEDHYHNEIKTSPVYSEAKTHLLIDTLNYKIKEELGLSSDQEGQLDALISRFKENLI